MLNLMTLPYQGGEKKDWAINLNPKCEAQL
jgi:hypothetical protein